MNLSNLSDKEIKILSEYLPTLLFKPSKKQKTFFSSLHKRRIIRAGNQTGKSISGALEAIWTASGLHPYKTVVTPNKGLVISADWSGYRSVTSKKIWEWIPKSLLEPDQDWNDSRGFKNQVLRFKNGSTILFKSAESSSLGLSGLTVDWAWIDEPPRKEVFGEILSRIAVANGPLWMTFTPIGRELTWLKDLITKQDWEEFVIALNLEDCPHRTLEDINNQTEGYGAWEYDQRVNGAWEGIEIERAFSSFNEVCIDDPDLSNPAKLWNIGVGIDHGEKQARETAVLLVWDDESIYIIDEYISSTATDTSQDAVEIINMLDRNGFRPEEVDLAYGDINTMGKGMVGYKINDILSRQTGITIYNASKGRVMDGVAICNLGFQRRNVKISPKCINLIKSIKHWKPDPNKEDLKHLIDAMIYICKPILDRHFNNNKSSNQIKLKR